MIKAGATVQLLINLLREWTLNERVLAIDKTHLQVLKETGKSPQSQSYLWVQCGGPPDRPILLCEYDPSRSAELPKRLLRQQQAVHVINKLHDRLQQNLPLVPNQSALEKAMG